LGAKESTHGTIHLWPEDQVEKDGQVATGFTLEVVKGDRKTIWYRVPLEFSSAITRWCDPYVLAVLFKAMNTPADLVVHGDVSPSLLDNLDEFQAAWSSWFPDRYTSIDIIPDTKRERPPSDHKNAVVAFSGGADSCYTAWHYRCSKTERLPFPLQAGIFIHGYDLPLKFQDTHDRAIEKARILLDSLGMTLIPLSTNLRTIRQHPVDAGGAFLASCLMLLQDHFTAGLIASSYCYSHLVLPFGANPITDRMMSSSTFSFRNDGARVSRIEKLESISEWPEAMQYLRICTGREAIERDRNCCRCEKCVRNILEFRALGLGKPSFFEWDVNNRQILALKYSPSTAKGHSYEDILTKARENRLSGSWLIVLDIAIFLNKFRFYLERNPWIDRILHGLNNLINNRGRVQHD
jgi:hypothetical protein